MSDVRVDELMPGDIVTAGLGEQACFIAQTKHPLWPQLQLVVWRLQDGSWSHDALDSRQVVGEVDPNREPRTRRDRLMGGALLGDGLSWLLPQVYETQETPQ